MSPPLNIKFDVKPPVKPVAAPTIAPWIAPCIIKFDVTEAAKVAAMGVNTF